MRGAPEVTAVQRDRAVGAVVVMAVGDALGAGYEFEPPVAAEDVAMIGGGLGPFAVGEWTDDTSMAVPLLQALAAQRDLDDPTTQDAVMRAWVKWRAEVKDVGDATAHALAAGTSAGGRPPRPRPRCTQRADGRRATGR